MPTKPPLQFDVLLTEEESQVVRIGQIEADANLQFKVVSALPEHREFLDETIELVNAKKVLHIQAAPPPGAPKFAVYSRQVERPSPEFWTELQAYLEKYYDVVLKPVAG